MTEFVVLSLYAHLLHLSGQIQVGIANLARDIGAIVASRVQLPTLSNRPIDTAHLIRGLDKRGRCRSVHLAYLVRCNQRWLCIEATLRPSASLII